MIKRFGTALVFFLVSCAVASDFSWKTLDVKTGPALGLWNDASTTMGGWSLSVVRPITPYVGVGILAEIAANISECEDCVNYDFAELSEGVLLNLNVPITHSFSLISNFMFLVNFQDGTVEGSYYTYPVAVEAYDVDGNLIEVYKRESDDGDYYTESAMFRSNLGVAWRSENRMFGLEMYPMDLAVTDGDWRITFKIDAVFHVL